MGESQCLYHKAAHGYGREGNTRTILRIDFGRGFADNRFRNFHERNNANERCLLDCLFLSFLLWHEGIVQYSLSKHRKPLTNEHARCGKELSEGALPEGR